MQGPTRQGRAIRRSSIGRRVAAITVASVLSIGLLAGCTGRLSSASSAAETVASAASGASSTGMSAADQSQGSTFQSTSGRSVAADRSITTSGRLQLSGKDPIGIATSITGLVEGSGGRVENVREQPDKHASAQLTARIPSAAFDATLAAIKKTGTVSDVSITGTDVTSRVTDYSVRTSTLRTSIARLEKLLDTATTTKDLVAIETTLEDRETALEQLLADQKGLSDQIAYSTLTIGIVQPSAVTKPAPSTFASGFVTGAAALGATIGALVVGLGVVLPWLGVLVLIGAVVLLIRRSIRGRRIRPAAGEGA